MRRKREQVIPEPCIVLDILPLGRPERRIRNPIAQLIGKRTLRLIEVCLKPGVFLAPHDELNLLDRDKIERILGYINYENLTEVAKTELPFAVEKIIDEKEKEFVDFFNKAGPITTRLHQLELLPGIGKRLLWKVLEEREKKPFESFEDIKRRVPQIADPKKMILERILIELMGKDPRHRVFVGVIRS